MVKRLSSALALAALCLASVASATDYESVTFTNAEPVQSTNVGAGTHFTNVFTVGGYNLGLIKMSGTLEEINGTTADFGTENRWRVVYPDGRFKDVACSTTTSYTGVLAFSNSFFLAYGASAPFGGGTWNFYYANTLDDAPGGGVADARCTITFTLSDEGTPATPPSSTDLGTLNNTGQVDPIPVLTQTDVHTAGQVIWYKVVIPEAIVGSKYLDIDTEGTTAFVTGNDTEIGVYDEYGLLVATDDDDGSANLSQLSFGPSAGSRSQLQTGTNALSAARNGRDGELSAGTYYVAVSGFNATFSNNFTVTSASTRTGPVSLNFRTNVSGAQPKVISGHVTLNDFPADCCAGQLVVIEIRQVGSTTPDHSETVTLDGNCDFTFTLSPAFPAGVYDITAKHAHFLRQKLSAQVVGPTGVSGLSYSLLNGDCDDDNEVGISDFAIISTSYGLFAGDPGYDARADLNCDDEVGIADYAIMSNNYGTFGDD